MRILGISETCDLASLYLRLIEDGHEVRVSVSEPLAQATMMGLVPRAEDWREHLEWVRSAGKEGVILFEAVGFGALQDELRREGYNVIGGSAFGDRLEHERGFAQKLLATLGLQSTPFAEFATAQAALADLKTSPRRTVFKVIASAGQTFVGSFDDGSDVIALLESLDPHPDQRFMLMDFVEGIEVGVGAYFNGERFLLPACVDWEHKRFFAGDMGELTGEMGTVASFVGSDLLFEACLRPLEAQLRDAKHVGYINLNTLVNETGIWPLEFTCRFGYPGFAVLESLQTCGWASLFRAMITPSSCQFEAKSGFTVGIVLTTPPFPWSRKELKCPVHLPVIAGDLDVEHLHWGEVGLKNGQIVTTGLYGWTAVVTGTGHTVDAARVMAYGHAAQVRAPNLRYRLDIGEKLIQGELDQLARWGWITSQP